MADLLDGKGMAWCVALAVLATLQRPQGGGLVVGIAIGLWLASKSRKVTWRDLAGVAVLVIGVVAAYELPNRLFRGTGPPGNVPLPISQVTIAVGNVVSLPLMLGVLLLPFAVGMLRRSSEEEHKLGRAEMIPVAIAFAGLVGAAKLIALHGSFLPGLTLGPWGLGPPTVDGTKVELFPVAVLLPFELLALAGAVVILIWRRRAWNPRLLGTAGTMLAVFSISQFLPLLGYGGFFDRYFVPVAAPLIPLLAAMVSASDIRPRVSAAWAVGLLCLGVVAYIVGQQDYDSWQTARDAAARIAYGQVPASEVDAGYEETAQKIWVPAANDPKLPSDVDKNPMIFLAFAGPDDPRPGVSYSSLAPGRIVILRAR